MDIEKIITMMIIIFLIWITMVGDSFYLFYTCTYHQIKFQRNAAIKNIYYNFLPLFIFSFQFFFIFTGLHRFPLDTEHHDIMYMAKICWAKNFSFYFYINVAPKKNVFFHLLIYLNIFMQHTFLPLFMFFFSFPYTSETVLPHFQIKAFYFLFRSPKIIRIRKIPKICTK